MHIVEPDCSFFVGEDICLRALEPEDLDFLYDIENDTAYWQYAATNVPYSRYALRQYLADNRNDIFADGQLRLVIADKTNGLPLGCIDLFDFNARHHRAEIGVAVLPPYRRRGIARQALSLLLRFAFSFLDLHQVYAYVSQSNVSSCRLFLDAGFTQTAVLPDWIRIGSSFHSVVLFSLLNQSSDI